MKPEIAEKWVKALRSKKYKQGQYVLKKRTPTGRVEHCCLGVLCELYNEQKAREQKKMPVHKAIKKQLDGLPRTFKPGTTVYSFNGKSKTGALTELPYRVMQWAGIKTEYGTFTGHFLRPKSLAGLNDRGYKFSQIADLIDKNFEEL